MALQIKNRREDLYIGKVPPVIPDGIVTDTDYPTSTKAGVVKLTPNTYGVRVSADGQLYGGPFTLAQYNNGSGNLFVTKTTLENVILSVLANKLAEALGDDYADAAVGTQWIIRLHKLSGGPGFNFDMIV